MPDKRPRKRKGKHQERILVEISLEEFVDELFGAVDDHYLTIMLKPSNRCISIAAGDRRRILALVGEHVNSSDIYFRTTPTRHPPPLGKLGAARMASALVGFHLDVDMKCRGRWNKKLPRSPKDVLRFLLVFPFFPTLIVWSGHGYHLYWLFREPWILENALERNAAMKLSREFEEAYRGLAMGTFKWKLDKTADLAHPLRLPETYNRKVTNIPVKAYRDKLATRYNPQDFDLITGGGDNAGTRPQRLAPRPAAVPQEMRASLPQTELHRVEGLNGNSSNAGKPKANVEKIGTHPVNPSSATARSA